MSLSRCPSASESTTSPSRMTPSGRSLEMADWMRPSATVTADRKSPSRSSPTLPRGPELAADLAMEITPGIGHPSSRLEIGPPPLDRRGRAFFRLQEVVYINVDELRPGEDADEPTERQERAEGNAFLACVPPLSGDHHEADDRPRQERHEHRRRDARAEVDAHHAGQLHVSHAHPGRVGERGEQQRGEGD